MMFVMYTAVGCGVVDVGWDEHPLFEVLQRINCGTVNEKTSLNAWLLSPWWCETFCQD
jgi:hypothetical protein